MFNKQKKANRLMVFLFTIPFFLLGFHIQSIYSQQPEQNRQNLGNNQEAETPQVTELVDVVNAEVIVRAMKKDQLVGGLKQSDFTLFEDGKQLPITSFTEVRRKIGFNETVTPSTSPEAIDFEEPIKKRVFFLYFRLYEIDPKVNEAVEYFFKKVYKKSDYVIIMVRNKVFSVTNEEQAKDVLTRTLQAIDEEVKEETFERDRFTDDIETFFREFHREFQENELELVTETREQKQQNLIQRTITQLKVLWEQYKYRHITVGLDKIKLLANSLKTMSQEKWGLVFYQREFFPMLNPQSLSTMRGNSYKYIDTLVKEFRDFTDETRKPQRFLFVDEIKQAFINANATFHLFHSAPRKVGKVESVYVSREEIYTNWQHTFKAIAEATGGAVIESRAMNDSLKGSLEKEDIFYRLTYAPAPGEKQVRDIQLKTKLSKIDLQYHHTVKLEQVGVIQIKNVSFSHPTLSLSLESYRQFFDGDHFFGDIGLKVSTVDKKGDMLTFEKELHPDKENLNLSMKVKFAEAGKHDLIIKAHDRQSGCTAVFKQKIDVPLSAITLTHLSYDPVLLTDTYDADANIGNNVNLDYLMQKTAAYCLKLKKVRFYFICMEEVQDAYWFHGKKVKDKTYYYDYQILMLENGTMKEARKQLLPKEEWEQRMKALKKSRKDKTESELKAPITNFYANYPFLMPLSMLALENQEKYTYRLLGLETINSCQTVKVSVEPKIKDKNESGAVYGVVWINPKDGSVLKIDVSPHSFDGVDGLKKIARNKRTDLKISDTHWYEISRNGVRFPSKTAISCIFMPRNNSESDAGMELENMKTEFLYKDYQFFNVSVETRHGDR